MGYLGYVTDMRLYRACDMTRDNPIVVDGMRLYTDLRWFELLEGEKQGIQIPIPINHPEYSSSLERKLEAVEENEYIEASLRSMNEKGTKWICESIKRDVDPAKYV